MTDCGVDQDGLAGHIAKEVAAPEIAMQEGGRLGREEIRQSTVQPFEMRQSGMVEQAMVGGQADLGSGATIPEKVRLGLARPGPKGLFEGLAPDPTA